MAVATITSGATITPRSITSYPLQPITTVAMFFPISCTSPFTVATSTLPADCVPHFVCSMSGCSIATACFMVRAALTTCGRNNLPSPKSSPTVAIPSISGPPMTSTAAPYFATASSRSVARYSPTPLSNAHSRRFSTGSERQLSSAVCCTAALCSFIRPAIVIRFSVASGLRLSTTSSSTSRSGRGISSYCTAVCGLTIPISIPAAIA